jgi:hypothetical protein
MLPETMPLGRKGQLVSLNLYEGVFNQNMLISTTSGQTMSFFMNRMLTERQDNIHE